MPNAVLSANELTYGYRRKHPLIESLTLEVPASTLTALTGPSGTGKSTLLYLLAGLLTPWSGSVTFATSNLTTLPDAVKSRQRAQQFGFIFQDFALDARRTVLDAVLEPALYAGRRRKDLRQRAEKLLHQMGVELRSDALPGQISGGQAQRVAVCRALLLEPVVIFADEPTGNLDHHSAEVVLDALQSAANSGASIIIATHDDRVVERCQNRVVLS